MTGERATRSAPRLAAVSALGLLVAGLAGCAPGTERCTELYSTVIGAVDGVTSVEIDCSEQFGGGWQRVDVQLATDDPDDARAIGEAVLQAIAAEPEMDPQWATPQDYYLEDGTEATIGLRELGFNGIPTVREVREHYGIEP
ncbi:hypothetical protein [Myceligenerans pegani]|uniref:Lipoprotein n=1 Tax=Myceligenerans pegani TaxID=2776917 RepID=A0ABR9MVZ8_9MICO|nr:hypothetical protein [Myceligenerans sp. TRM 65318]MBE1875563.1 hypothetical protein [Myceligenerans sp. TRM 65318]MBE3017834.1 hypothetical protein [Myceligenerans sp. TRM 65318]